MTGFLMIQCFIATEAKAQCCDYHLVMSDSYGDGWQGGNVQVFINNTNTGVYHAINYVYTVNFTICNGDSLSLVYTPGAYENENSYRIFDASWNLIYQAGPNPDTGHVFTAVGNCAATVLPGSHPCTAIPIDTGQCVFTDNTGFPTTGLNPGCSDYKGGEIWYKMVVPQGGNLHFETDSGNISDTALGIWAGSSCDSLTRLGCDDDGGTGYYSRIVLEQLTPGQVIYVQVFGYGGAQGTFRLCVYNYIPVKLVKSELPLVIINTLGKTILNDSKVDCLMDIKYNGPGNITYVSDSANIYSGHIGIEIRGATSASYPQKPFNIETRDSSGNTNNVSLLGLPKENDWVLISNYGDRSLMRNLLPHKLFREMGNYSPRLDLCEVLIDSTYTGIYLFGEKIKRDKNRVHIATLTATDTTGDQLTGGYILQQNYWDPATSFLSNYSPINHPGLDIHFLYEYPKPPAILPAQKAYIAAYVDSLETALYSTGFADINVGYRKYLDTKSFIDYFLVNELARNADGFKKSIFYYKDKNSNGGKLKAGPVWDFDWAWKNISACAMFAGFDGSGWAHHINDCGQQDINSSEWYIRMLQDSTFRNELRCTYDNYRKTILDTSNIFSYIDSTGLRVKNAQVRHFYKWPILGEAVAAPETGPLAVTYYAELDSLKGWIATRLHWLDANMPGLCATTGVAEPESRLSVWCFPNPADNQLTIQIKNQWVGSSFDIYNQLGRMVQSGRLTSETTLIQTTNWPSGIYLVKVGTDNQFEVVRVSVVR
jgi:hypothetical protein